MSYKVGDKVFLEGEILRIYDNAEESPYYIGLKNNAGYFCNEGDMKCINKTYEDGLNDGLNDAWELVRKLYDFTCNKLEEIYGVDGCFYELIKKYTAQEALKILEAYEESKVIKVGDVVYAQGIKGVVTDDCTEDSDDTCYVFCENGNIEDWKFVDLKKTGRHIDIEHLLEQIRGE